MLANEVKNTSAKGEAVSTYYVSNPTHRINTGASSGEIGQVRFARHYASQGCRLILTATCRGDQLEKLTALAWAAPAASCLPTWPDPAQWDNHSAAAHALETERIARSFAIQQCRLLACAGAFTETDFAVEQEMLQVVLGARCSG